MIRIGRSVHASETFSPLNKIEERLPTYLGCRLVVGIIQKLAGGAIEENRIVLGEILRRHHGGIVGNGRHPRACLVSEILNHLRRQRDGTMYPADSLAQHQYATEALGSC